MTKAKTVFKGRLLRVVTRTTRLPNGHVIDLEMVEHPGAVLIIPFLSRSRMLILRQFRPVIGAYIYELPAGTLEKAEKPIHCARREVQEETGYAAEKMTRLGTIYPVPGYSTEKIFMYTAEQLRPCHGAPEKDEVIRTHVVTRQQVRRLYARGQIVDAKTICALHRCGWL
jgi:ADP-ribose pyrophosphatase